MNTNDLFRPIGGVFTSPPDIVAWGPGQTNLFAFAVGTDQALWYSELHGFFGNTNPWSEWQSLGGVVLSRPRAVSKGESVVDVFAAGAGSELLRWRFVNGAWTSSESLGGIIVSPPDAVLFGDLPPSLDTIPVFALGTDHALWAWNGSWATLGHRLSSPPHAVRWQGDFAVFALGIDSAVWYTMGGDWHSLGGRFRSAPYAVSTSTRIHVFAADTQSELQHRSWDGNSWTGWESLGGILMSPPTASSFQTNEPLEVCVLGTDSAIWRRRLNTVSGPWSDWGSLGGRFVSPPSTITRAPEDTPTRDYVALGIDHSVWHFESMLP